jgi:hypothetical protein
VIDPSIIHSVARKILAAARTLPHCKSLNIAAVIQFLDYQIETKANSCDCRPKEGLDKNGHFGRKVTASST